MMKWFYSVFLGICLGQPIYAHTDDVLDLTEPVVSHATNKEIARYSFDIISIDLQEPTSTVPPLSCKDVHPLQQKIFDRGLPFYLDFAVAFDSLKEPESKLNIENSLEGSLSNVITEDQQERIRSIVTIVDYKDLKRRFYALLEDLKKESFMVNQEPYWMLGSIDGKPKSSYWLESVAVARLSHLPVGYINSHQVDGVKEIFGNKFFDHAGVFSDTVNIVMIDDIHYSGMQLHGMMLGVLKALRSDYAAYASKVSNQGAQGAPKVRVNLFMYSLLMAPIAIESMNYRYGEASDYYANTTSSFMRHDNISTSIMIKYVDSLHVKSAGSLLDPDPKVMGPYVLKKALFSGIGFAETQGLVLPLWKCPDSQSMWPFLPKICGVVPCREEAKPYSLDVKTIDDLMQRARGVGVKEKIPNP